PQGGVDLAAVENSGDGEALVADQAVGAPQGGGDIDAVRHLHIGEVAAQGEDGGSEKVAAFFHIRTKGVAVGHLGAVDIPVAAAVAGGGDLGHQFEGR